MAIARAARPIVMSKFELESGGSIVRALDVVTPHISASSLESLFYSLSALPQTKPWVSSTTTVRSFLVRRSHRQLTLLLIVLHDNHFRKDWQLRVRTWFDQPGRKLRRRQARKAKAATLGVRPLTLLRPAVRAQTVRYNRKIREGRGFTLAELKEAGIGRKEARGVGIVVDHRRRNLSEEGKALNIERLKAYKARLIVFPRNSKKPKKGDSTVRPPISDGAFATNWCCQGEELSAATTRANLSIPEAYVHEAPRRITDEERGFKAYRTLREERGRARSEGQRKLREAKVRTFSLRLVASSDVRVTLVEGGGGGEQEEVDLCSLSHHFAPPPYIYACRAIHVLKSWLRPGLSHYMPYAPIMTCSPRSILNAFFMVRLDMSVCVIRETSLLQHNISWCTNVQMS